MKLDVNVLVPNLLEMPQVARAAEQAGFDGLWTSETKHDPFLPLALAAEHTTRLELGTAIAVAFARAPTGLAHLAWDLARASEGRFILGLGTQVKAHVERRFGMPWEAPAPKLREMILAIRAVWQAWQGDGHVNFRGEFFKITLMTEFFNPGPIAYPDIPIYIAGVNEHLCRVAGELCQGFHVHPLHTPAYLRQVVLPNIARGAQAVPRDPAEVRLASTVLVATDAAEREAVRAQIAFYASTPTYRTVLAVHGWEEIGERLSHLAARGRWDEMPSLVTDDMLETVALVAPREQLPARIRERYDGLLDRVALYRPFVPERASEWRDFAAAIREP